MTKPTPLPLEAYTECWYVPGETHIVDLIHPDTGLTLHLQQDAAEVRERYPTAERMTCDAAFDAADEVARSRYRRDVGEITEERFNDALNVLPPVGWTTRQGVESFRISERIWGNLTDIYARAGDRYFSLADDIRLPPDVVAERVRAFITAHPTSTLPPAPVRPEGEPATAADAAQAPAPGSGT